MKALVLEKRGDLAAILREDGTYTTTKQSCTVGETIELNAEIILLPHRRKTWARAAVAAVLALVLFSGSYTYLATSAYAYVSLDAGETSVEVTVNRLGRVISVDAMNSASEETAKTLTPELRGKRLEDALPAAMERIRPVGGEDASDAYLIAGVTSGTEKRREELVETVKQATEKLDGEKPTVITFEIPPEERHEAEENGMSGGRYAFEQRSAPPPEEAPRVGTKASAEGTPPEKPANSAPPEMPENPAESVPFSQPPQPAPSDEAPKAGQPTGAMEASPTGEAPTEGPVAPPDNVPPSEPAQPAGEAQPTEPALEQANGEAPSMPEQRGEAPDEPPQGMPYTPQEAPPSEAAAAPTVKTSGGAPGPMPTAMGHGPEGQIPPPEEP